MQVVDVIVGSVLAMGLTYTFVRCDSLRIPALWRERGWNAATTGAAIFAFSPLCIVAYFWVTRRSPSGILKGLVALIALMGLQVGLHTLFDRTGWLGLIGVLVLAPLLLQLAPWLAFAIWINLSAGQTVPLVLAVLPAHR
ncbi:MAG: hypothetical protein MUF54_01895 [Polyangiaceae bacterium]|nr:hypothetical protein [Polyangiaceae bacterium]